MDKRKRIRVEKATVAFQRYGGQGVLVNGDLILTAAHCINHDIRGGMVLGDYYIEEIKTSEGELLKVKPLVVEPVSDIAVVGALDGQVFYQESEQFEDFCERTEPVPLSVKEFEHQKEVLIHIYTHKKTWVQGTATRRTMHQRMLGFNAKEEIEAGTSGSPIVSDTGELVGIASNSSMGANRPEYTGSFPQPHLALPVWVCRRIETEEYFDLEKGGDQ